ncbi:MAG: DUF1800 family protein [Bacteroidota bacterium]
MKALFTCLTFFCLLAGMNAQVYDDFLGTGQADDISFTSSDPTSDGLKALNGSGYDLDTRGSSRFLAHTTLGYTIEDVAYVSEIGLPAWIDEQMEMPVSEYTDLVLTISEQWRQNCDENLGVETCNIVFRNTPPMFRTAWWDTAMKQDDQLRQRVAMALSEIVVISDQSNLQFFAQGLSTFYDILARNAFGNYEDILQEVTTNTAMGFYLSHLNNPPTDEVANIRPDENYAREIMQLFTIGLYELNNDGSRQLDDEGRWIPTYDNDDIKGLAKVFTGLGGSRYGIPIPQTPPFGTNYQILSFTDTMRMFEQFHEPGEKVIVGGHVIPAGQSGMADIYEAINVLFNHQNTAPFLSYRLIQRLVKSNPSPEYVNRVASVFNDNGEGERGDLGAVVRAILLDEEAYECYWIDDFSNGMLRAPMLRYTQMMRGLRAEAESEIFHNSGQIYKAFTEQFILSAPTVFNFYTPDYSPNADFQLYNNVGPEFQILNSGTSSNYVNFMLFSLMNDYINGLGVALPNYLNGPDFQNFDPDTTPYEAALTDPLFFSLGDKPEQLVDYLDILMANGGLSEDTKDRIITSLSGSTLFQPQDAALYALFLVMIDPDYTIMK